MIYQEIKSPKVSIMAYLIEEHKVSLEKIANLTIKDVSSSGIKVGGMIAPWNEHVKAAFEKYWSMAKDSILSSKLLFPGKNNEKVSEKNLKIALRNQLKKIEGKNYTLKDLGLIPERTPKATVLYTLDDILKEIEQAS